MRDIPVFSTQLGVAGLGLKEIPYSHSAYITVFSTQCPAEFLQECCAFCRSCGAERIYAKGHSYLERYPLHTEIWRMRRSQQCLPQTDAVAVPVTEQTLSAWRQLYNDRMQGVDNAAYLSEFDGKALLKKGNAYFVYREETLLGIGIADADTVQAVAAVQRGSGQDVLLALCRKLTDREITVEVASTNAPALALYRRLGFIKTGEESRWYCIE